MMSVFFFPFSKLNWGKRMEVSSMSMDWQEWFGCWKFVGEVLHSSCICVFTITESIITRFCGMTLFLMLLVDECFLSCFTLHQDFLLLILSRDAGTSGEVCIFDDMFFRATLWNVFFILTHFRVKRDIYT